MTKMESPRDHPAPPYIPIDCSFYDRLEEAATLRREVRLRYRDGDMEAEVRGVIADLGIADGAEWLTMEDGFRLRLDQLIALDDHEVPPVSGCG